MDYSLGAHLRSPAALIPGFSAFARYPSPTCHLPPNLADGITYVKTATASYRIGALMLTMKDSQASEIQVSERQAKHVRELLQI